MVGVVAASTAVAATLIAVPVTGDAAAPPPTSPAGNFPVEQYWFGSEVPSPLGEQVWWTNTAPATAAPGVLASTTVPAAPIPAPATTAPPPAGPSGAPASAPTDSTPPPSTTLADCQPAVEEGIYVEYPPYEESPQVTDPVAREEFLCRVGSLQELWIDALRGTADPTRLDAFWTHVLPNSPAAADYQARFAGFIEQGLVVVPAEAASNEVRIAGDLYLYENGTATVAVCERWADALVDGSGAVVFNPAGAVLRVDDYRLADAVWQLERTDYVDVLEGATSCADASLD